MTRLVAPLLWLLRLLAMVELAATVTSTKKPRRSGRSRTGPGRDEPPRPRYLTNEPLGPGKRITQGKYVIRWIEANCVHTNDRWYGKPFRLLPWQKAFILRLFEVDPKKGRRRYRWALLGVPKKNGKTELAAALGLYFAFGSGEPAALVICAASADHQADLVFNAAAVMAKESPTLSQYLDPLEDEITSGDPDLAGCKLKRHAVGAGTLDGPNIYVCIIDELHEWILPKHERTFTVLTQGGVTRLEPLVLMITTAGVDVETSICGKQYLDGIKAATGVSDDPDFYFEWWEAAEGAPHTDPETWRSCNPSLDVTVQRDYLEGQTRRKAEGVFRRYFLCQWGESDEERIVPMDLWDACTDERLGLDPRLPAYVFVDMALRRDSAAVAVAQKLPSGRIVVRVMIWENPYPTRDPLYDKWKLEVSKVEGLLWDLYELFPTPACEIDGKVMPGPEFNYDPHFFERSAQVLEGEGLAMVEMPQTDSRMIPVCEDFFELVANRLLAHKGSDQLRRHVKNAVPHEKSRGRRISKPRGSTRKIDGCIAAAGAAHRAMRAEPPSDRTFEIYF